VEELIKQNNAIDIYEEYFNHDVIDHSSEQPSAKTLTVFRDPAQKKGITRSAPYISWHPDGGRKMAVSYAIMEFQQQPAGMPVSSYVWDVNNPNSPEMELAPASQVCCAVYNPKDANVLVRHVTFVSRRASVCDGRSLQICVTSLCNTIDSHSNGRYMLASLVLPSVRSR
jgi:hypothetical protein